ncbi:CHRD domain-containing protein [Nonomuraea aurantiaca]|uniref:CHRD domain-containing protein n=1 Tax=Nonomuraea aurantiaca TaxID=2878562 RepID=UPI001CDA1CBA|nr:CHRD domain-containing protein [Nonomuraea aurantiaca]MCA2224606.1 CHRD domain-containing protein [Nonomuraea aurantiaca]
MSRSLAVATLTTAALVTGLVALPGPATASPAGAADRGQRVVMTGRQEVPGPGDPDGHGAFTYQVKGETLCYTIAADRILPATAAHIHKGKKGVAGPITVTLKTPTKGPAKGCIKAAKHQSGSNAALVLTQSELHGIVKSPARYYVNVHNAKYPDGAIRGQLPGGGGGSATR